MELGRRAARLLLRRAEEPDAPVALVMLEPALIVRGSTGPPPMSAD
jgi:DNA-binding LacI/PurR family transcriptional regulator